MEIIKVNHATHTQLKLEGAIWWEQEENTPEGNIGEIVKVEEDLTPKDAPLFSIVYQCVITQIIRTVNSNRYIYRLVKLNHDVV